MSNMVEDEEADNEEVAGLYQQNRSSSPNTSLQDLNLFILPKIYLVKTNRAGAQAQD